MSGLAPLLCNIVEADVEVFTEFPDVGASCSLTQWVYNTVLRSRLDGPGKFHGADPERFILALEGKQACGWSQLLVSAALAACSRCVFCLVLYSFERVSAGFCRFRCFVLVL